MVGATTYGALHVDPCPPEQRECDADVIFARMVGATLAVLIYALGFGALIYYLIKRGRKLQKKYTSGISEPPIMQGKKTKLFEGSGWLKEVLTVTGLYLSLAGITEATLPSYLGFPISIGGFMFATYAIRKSTIGMFKSQRWGNELFVILLAMIASQLIVRDRLEFPYSLPLQIGIVVFVIWLIHRHSIKDQLSQMDVNQQV